MTTAATPTAAVPAPSPAPDDAVPAQQAAAEQPALVPGPPVLVPFLLGAAPPVGTALVAGGLPDRPVLVGAGLLLALVAAVLGGGGRLPVAVASGLLWTLGLGALAGGGLHPGRAAVLVPAGLAAAWVGHVLRTPGAGLRSRTTLLVLGLAGVLAGALPVLLPAPAAPAAPRAPAAEEVVEGPTEEPASQDPQVRQLQELEATLRQLSEQTAG